MKTMNLLVIFLYALAGNCFSPSPRAEVHRSNTQIIDFILDFQEKQLVDVAEAMPAEKYGFAHPEVNSTVCAPSPSNLNTSHLTTIFWAPAYSRKNRPAIPA